MTLAEIDRKCESYKRVQKAKAKERAIFDHTLAMLVGRAMNASEQYPYPSLYDSYPSIFEEDIKRAEEEYSARQAKLAAIRFRQFAESHNRKLTEDTN